MQTRYLGEVEVDGAPGKGLGKEDSLLLNLESDGPAQGGSYECPLCGKTGFRYGVDGGIAAPENFLRLAVGPGVGCVSSTIEARSERRRVSHAFCL